MAKHSDEGIELVKRFLGWAYGNGLRPSVEAVPAGDGRGPAWRIGCHGGGLIGEVAFADDEAAGAVAAFARAVEIANPAVPPFEG